MALIFVIEDDAGICEAVTTLLASAGYEARGFGSASAALEGLRAGPVPSLILLDLQLPDRDGLSLASELRVLHDIPIVMLTARSDEIDRIVGLEIGADDYVAKPFSNRELIARIKAVLRRTERRGNPPLERSFDGYRFGDFAVNTDIRRIERRDGSPVHLTAAEFDLLLAFLSAPKRVLSRDHLLQLTHRSDHDIYDRTIDVLILRLRRKLEPAPGNPRFIRTERGVGYVFDADVTSLRP